MRRRTSVLIASILGLSAVTTALALAAAKTVTRPAFSNGGGGGPWPPIVLPAAKTAAVRSGMTLGELVDALGPGAYPPLTGAGILEWKFDDGKTLSVLTRTGEANDTLWPAPPLDESAVEWRNDPHRADGHFGWR